MKKILFFSYLAVAVLITVTPGCNESKDDKDQTVTTTTTSGFKPLKERTGELAKLPDWLKVQTGVSSLMTKIQKDPNDLKSKLILAEVYIQEARVTGDHPYYYPAAQEILDDILKRDPKHFDAMALKASIQLSLHKFADALVIGQQALKINDRSGYIYGVLVDANVELGNYQEALAMSDSMQKVKPGLESYARASYLREIFGDYAGSKEAMKLAVKAGLPGSEPQSWAQYTLAHLYEVTGDLKNDQEQLEQILAIRPSYAFAYAGLARIKRYQKQYDSSLALLDRACSLLPEFSFYEEKADLYKEMKQPEKAKALYDTVIKMLNTDAASGHNTDHELAIVYYKSGDLDQAETFAKKEFNKRPDNIDVANTMAWVNYLKGNYPEASRLIKTSLKTNSQNPTLLCRAGLIAIANGDKSGNAMIQKAMKTNPYLDNELKELVNSKR